MSAVARIAEAKALLDAGTITRREFEQLKAQAIAAAPPARKRASPLETRLKNILGLILLAAVAAIVVADPSKRPARTAAEPQPVASHAPLTLEQSLAHEILPSGKIKMPHRLAMAQDECQRRVQRLIDDGTWTFPKAADVRALMRRSIWTAFDLNEKLLIIKIVECAFAGESEAVSQLTIADSRDGRPLGQLKMGIIEIFD